MADEQIEAVRQRIDALDAQLLQLVNERARLAQEIGHLKQGANDAPVYRPEREAMIIQRLQQASLEQMDRWTDQALTAQRLDEVFRLQ